MKSRYIRNIGSIITEKTQQELLGKTILQIGCGGTGGYIADLLVRLGINSLILFDGDKFEETNLNRQLTCSRSNMGKYKSSCLRDYLLDIGDTKIIAYEHYFGSEESDSEIFDNISVDYIIWAADKNSSTLEALNFVEAALERGIPVFTAGLQPYGVGVATYTKEDKEVFHQFFSTQWQTSTEFSVPAYLCALAAGFLINDIVKFLNNGRADFGQKFEYNAQEDKIHKFDYQFGQLS